VPTHTASHVYHDLCACPHTHPHVCATACMCMCQCSCGHMHMCMCQCSCGHMHMCLCQCSCGHMHMCMCQCSCGHMHMCMCQCTCGHMHVCMCQCSCGHMHVCMCQCPCGHALEQGGMWQIILTHSLCWLSSNGGSTNKPFGSSPAVPCLLSLCALWTQPIHSLQLPCCSSKARGHCCQCLQKRRGLSVLCILHHRADPNCPSSS